MNWFRLYVDARNDAKLRTLTDAEHRVWFNLLCYSAEQQPRGSVTGVTRVTDVTDDLLLAIEVANGDTSLLNATIDKLLKLRILAFDDDGMTFVNFKKRQYDKPSDTPEETRRRKAEQRERERAGKPSDVTPENDASRDVTPGHAHTQNRTDTDSENKNNSPQPPKGGDVRAGFTSIDGGKSKPKRPQTKYPDDFETFWQAYPSGNGNKQRSYEQWKRIKPDADLMAEIMAGLERWKQCDRWKRGFVKAAEIWLKDAWWANDPPGMPGSINGAKSYDIRDYTPDQWPALAYGPARTPEELELSRQAAERLMG